MTIAYDTATEVVATANPTTVAHTPGAAPAGVVVAIAHSTTNANIVTSVSYGSLVLTLLDTKDTLPGTGRVYVYWSGSVIPSGVQTLSIARTEATTSLWAAVATATAARDVEVVDSGNDRRNGTNPQVPLAYAGRDCLSFGAIFSHRNLVTDLVELTAETRVFDNDFGSEVGVFSRTTAVTNGDFVMGWTASSDNIAEIALALSEIPAVGAPDALPQTQQGADAPRSPAFLRQAVGSVRTLSELTTLLARELSRIASRMQTYERVAVLFSTSPIRPSGHISRVLYLTVPNTSAFTISNPERGREGVVIVFDILNSSGGTMGAVTWDSEYELNGTFQAPANNAHVIYSFYRTADGKWREMSRSGVIAGGGGVGAPTSAEYLVGAADATLSAERVVTNTTSVTWDLATAGQAKAKLAALTGDVTAAADSNATTIAANAVTTAKVLASAITYAKIQNVSATDKVLGRVTAGAGVVEEIACTAAGRTLIAGADAVAQRNSLGIASFRADADQATFVNAQTNITGMSFSIAASESWMLDICLSVTMGTAATGVKFYFTFPASCTGEIHYGGNVATLPTWQTLYQAVLTVPGTFFVTGIITGQMTLRAVIRNSTTAGTIQLVGITGGATTTCAVKKGSSMLCRRYGT